MAGNARKYTETFSADGDSVIYQVSGNTGQSGVEPIGYSIAGTWGSGTATLYVCYDTTASPLVFAPPANGAWTADIADKLDIPNNCYIKFTLSGSTTPSLGLTLYGDIKPA